jgi:hypothetical protein
MENMNIDNFNFATIKQLFEVCPAVLQGKKYVKIVSQECQDYMDKYFFQSEIGNYYFWKASTKEFIVMSFENFKRFYLDISTNFK